MNKKVCITCEIEKEFFYFPKRKSSKDGYRNECKLCLSNRVKVYQKTKKGLLSCIYNDQLKSCKKRPKPYPTYTKKELGEWLFSQSNFDKLYKNWVNSGHKKDLRPSVDRIDDNISYNMSNIQLMTWKENNEKGYKTRTKNDK